MTDEPKQWNKNKQEERDNGKKNRRYVKQTTAREIFEGSKATRKTIESTITSHTDNNKSQKNKKNTKYTKEAEIKNPKIINLSCKTFTKQQLDILKKGLKFTPTPQKNLVDLKNDLKVFANKLRTIEYFANNKPTSNDNIEASSSQEITLLVKNKTNFCASKSENNFENQVEFLANLPLDNIYTKLTNNLSKTQWFAFKSLMNDKQIIIKKSRQRRVSRHYEC